MSTNELNDTINNLFDILIDSTKSTAKTKGVLYSENSEEYQEVQSMIIEKFGYISSKVVDVILSNIKNSTSILNEFADILKKKMPVIVSQAKDKIDSNFTQNGKFGEYEKIDATTKVLGKKHGEALKDGCQKFAENFLKESNTNADSTNISKVAM